MTCEYVVGGVRVENGRKVLLNYNTYIRVLKYLLQVWNGLKENPILLQHCSSFHCHAFCLRISGLLCLHCLGHILFLLGENTGVSWMKRKRNFLVPIIFNCPLASKMISPLDRLKKFFFRTYWFEKALCGLLVENALSTNSMFFPCPWCYRNRSFFFFSEIKTEIFLFWNRLYIFPHIFIFILRPNIFKLGFKISFKIQNSK